VILRFGVVLGQHGGVLQPLIRITKLFLGGRAGDGCQYMSWVHLEDAISMFRRVIEDDGMAGVFNATAPEPARNAEFMCALRQVLHRPWSPPAPNFAIRLGALLMGTDASLALEGQRCVPKRFSEQGFRFRFGELRRALEAAVEG
jgi:uncharacterized protein (TIGR01777 family)